MRPQRLKLTGDLPDRVQVDAVSHQLIEPGDQVGVAVSGGADSTALLYALYAASEHLRLNLTVLHLNHGLRGAEAARDADMVREHAESLGLPLVVDSVCVSDMRQRGESIEMAARRLRYLFYRNWLHNNCATSIATGHNADDQAETVLMRLCRGTTLRGAGGIRRRAVVDGVKVVRPVLALTRKELRDWLKRNNVYWTEDSSNRSPEFLRNRVRREVLPCLSEQVNPASARNIACFAETAALDDELLSLISAKRLTEIGLRTDMDALPLALLSYEPPALQRRWIASWLSQHVGNEDVTGALVLRIIDTIEKAEVATISINKDWFVDVDAELLQLRQATNILSCAPFDVPVEFPGQTDIPVISCSIVTERGRGIRRDETHHPGLLPAVATLRLPKGRENEKLHVRNIKPGDRFQPLGMGGSRKLQDVFVDLHVPVENRSRIPLLLCGETIIWVPGYRIAAEWSVAGNDEPSMLVKILSDDVI